MSYFHVFIDFITRDIPIHLINLVTSLLPNHILTNRLRGFMMRPFFGKCGKKLQIGKGVIINNPGKLFLGNNCYISHYCYIQAKGIVTLYDNVIIGPMSVIASSKHIFESRVVTNKGISSPIVIGEGTWLGGHVVILSGVNIGKGVTIGAGSVVTRCIEDNQFIVGIPATPKMKDVKNEKY